MLYRTMKKTGDELSILGFGCMRLPQKRGRIDEKRATRQIRFAIDQGVNYLDTAVPYHMGASETFLGRALTDGYREKIKLATKLPPGSIKTREEMDMVLNGQLDRLKTESIDYYLLHGLNGETWNKIKQLGACEFLDKAKADGRIGYAGFSFHGDIDAFKDIVDAYDWEFCQIQYNYLDENNQAGTEGLKYASEKGLGVIIMEPLRGGNLSGKVPPAVQAIWDDAETKRSPAEWGLRWIWNHPEVTVVLSGMNREDHIEENLRIAGEAHPESLSDKELQLVGRVVGQYQSLMKVGCTGCRYCMPCPSGVDIPSCFEYYNRRHVFGDKITPKVMYLVQLGGVGVGGGVTASYASLCQKCGECEENCPQHLPIPELLEDVAGEFEGRGFKVLGWILKFLINDLPRWLVLRRARQVEKRRGKK